MLDEQALRRPGFRPDVPVKLAGQTFYLPKPRVKLSRRTAPDGTHKIVTEARLGDDYGSVLEAYEDAIEAGSGTALAMFNLAAALLTQNYNLTDSDVDGLLEFWSDDAENDKLWGVIIATGRGQAPKPEGSTGDQA